MPHILCHKKCWSRITPEVPRTTSTSGLTLHNQLWNFLRKNFNKIDANRCHLASLTKCHRSLRIPWCILLALQFLKTNHHMIHSSHKVIRIHRQQSQDRMHHNHNCSQFSNNYNINPQVHNNQSQSLLHYQHKDLSHCHHMHDRPARSLELLGLNRKQYHRQRLQPHLFYLLNLYHLISIQPLCNLQCEIQTDLMIIMESGNFEQDLHCQALTWLKRTTLTATPCQGSCSSDVFNDNLAMVTRVASNPTLNPTMTKAKAMMMLTARLLKMFFSLTRPFGLRPTPKA